jgi:hypothetical protein
MEDYENNESKFWREQGVTFPMRDEKIEQLRNILNERGIVESALHKDQVEYIKEWYTVKMVEMYQQVKQKKDFDEENYHIDELFPDESEIIEMLDKKGIGKKPIETDVKKVKMGDINPFYKKQGGKRRKRRRKTSVPKRYVPKQLSKKDKKKQGSELKKSRQAYKKGKYHTRKKMKSFKSKVSPHIIKARKMYKVDKITPNKKLAKACGCKIQGLRKIVKKGQGAYFSSGSRPNQTGHSWGYARMASSITGGKASAVDYNILEKYCTKKSKALKLAKKMRGKGTRRVKQVKIGGRSRRRRN